MERRLLTVQKRGWLMKGLIKFLDDGAESEIHKSEDLGRNEGGITCSAEDGPRLNGIPVFDYYEEGDYLMRETMEEFAKPGEKVDFSKIKKTYDGGIHTEMRNYLDERGWYAEWDDPGTMGLWLK